jgi:branched-chain amino acid transport system permease protein
LLVIRRGLVRLRRTLVRHNNKLEPMGTISNPRLLIVPTHGNSIRGTKMDLTLIPQAAINGLLLGSVYVLIALGFTLIFGILTIVNFAHGEMYMLGGFVIYYVFGELGCNYFLAMIITTLILTLFGMGVEKVIFRQLRGYLLGGFIASLGLSWVLVQSSMVIFGITDKAVPPAFTGTMTVLGASFPFERVAGALIGFALTGLLFLFIRYTKTGKAMRAVSQDREASYLQGINVDRINNLGFGIGCGLAGAAGGLMAPIFYISPNIGGPVLMKAFVVVVLGGMGNIPGAVVGGMLLGVLESFGSIVMPITSVQLLFFVVIVVVLLFVPNGLGGIFDRTR